MLIQNKVGAVVIGRNEGERLRTCLESLSQHLNHITYVDSGSSDDSVNLATKMGIIVVQLDMSQPFTAARARNAGFKALVSNNPDLKYVQFIDGDCQLVSGWLEASINYLEQHGDYAVTCGRRRERFPEKSIYNQLCDFEWDTQIGETTACGGDALINVKAFTEVNGYRDDLIAGEEPELCLRLRAVGWHVWRLDEEMTLHDASILKFSQWWKRTQRSGYAFAEGAFLHGAAPQKHWVKESRSAWFWGAVIPVITVIVVFFQGLVGWAVLLIYPIQIGRLALLGKHLPKENFLRASFLVIGKFPELLGQLQFLWNRLIGTSGRLIEYK
jgi:glycosyltransferase involved in cell wall biosynthesis